jgi:hypothetical protein
MSPCKPTHPFPEHAMHHYRYYVWRQQAPQYPTQDCQNTATLTLPDWPSEYKGAGEQRPIRDLGRRESVHKEVRQEPKVHHVHPLVLEPSLELRERRTRSGKMSDECEGVLAHVLNEW